MFKELGSLGSLFKQAREMGSRMQGLSDELRKRRVSGAAGGGMVEIEVNGLVEVLRCRIDPSLLGQNDAEMLEDLVVAAVNQAVQKAKQLHAETVRELTGGMPIPGLDQALERLLNVPEEGKSSEQNQPTEPPKDPA